MGLTDEMRTDAIADQAQRIHDFADAHEPDIGPAEPGIGDAAAGDIERLKSAFLRDHRGQRIVDAGRNDDRLAVQAVVETFGFSHGHIPK